MNIETITSSPSDSVVTTSATEVAPEETKTKETASVTETDETSEASDASDETEGDADETEKPEVDGSDEGEESESKPKKKGGVQKRIDKLTKRASESEREATFWKSKALEAEALKAQPKTETPKRDQTGEPDVNDFETHREYLDALIDFRADAKLSDRDAKSQAEKLKTEFQSRVKTHVEKVKEFAKTHADFNEVLAEVEDFPMSIAVQDAILDGGPEMHYELAKNPELLEKLNSMGFAAAQREIGRIEERLAVRKTQKTEKKLESKAPAPIKAVGSNSSGTVKKSLDEMSYDEFKKAREEQLRAR